jgi:hypothetical protein
VQSATNLARVYWMGIPTISHTENKLKLVEFVMNCDIGKQGHEKYVIRTNKINTSYINDLINYNLLILYYY